MLMFPNSPADSKQPLLNIKGTVHRSGGDLNTFGSSRTPKHRYPTWENWSRKYCTTTLKDTLHLSAVGLYKPIYVN